MRLPLRAVAVSFAVLACAPDLTLPNGGKGLQITCQSDADCPAPLFCSAVGRCVPTRDDVPPDLAGDVDVTPRRGRKGTAFAISFAVTEELAEPPTVTLLLATPLVVACTTDAPAHWTCPWTARGTENEGRGGAVPVRIGLVDAFGLAATKDGASLTLDFEPPAAAAHTVQPAIAKLGAELQLFVTFSEELAGEPAAKASVPLAQDGGASASVALVRDPGTLNYRFRHVVTAEDPEGNVTFAVEASDLVGNPSGTVALGSVRIDRTGPVVSNGAVFPSFANDGTQVSARFHLSKPPAGEPRVTAGGLSFTRDPSVDPPNYRYTRTVVEADGAGPRAVLVEATDAAGNAVVQSLGTVELDFEKPRLLSAAASPARARLGDALLVSLQPSEPLGAPPTMTLDSPGPAFDLVPNTAWAFAHTVVAADGTGTWRARFHLVDRAGNEDDVEAPDAFLVDAKTPEISSLSVNGTRFSRQPGFDRVVVTFHLSEPLGEAPAELVVTLGARVLTCATDAAGLEVTCATSVQPEDAEGSQRVQVTARDAAGNVAFESVPLEFDFTPPRLVAASVTPSPARTGDLVAYTVTADEPLAAAPALTAAPPLAFTAVADTTWVLQRRLDGTEAEGPHAVRIALVDRVGNASPDLAGVPVVLDSTAPVISSLVANPARVPAGGTVTASFLVDDALDAAALSVRLGGRSMACAATAGVTHGWTCTRTLASGEAPDEAETPADVVVQARDGAGNVGSASTRVVFDLRAPDLVPGSDSLALAPAATNLVRTPTAVTDGTTVRLSFALDEAVDPAIPPSVVARLGDEELVFGKAAVAGNTWVFEKAVQGASEGSWALEVRVVDVAGNARTISPPTGRFVVDTTAPAAPDVGTADKVTYTRIPWGSTATQGVPRFTLEGAAGAAAPGLVLAYDGPALATANEIGRATAKADGSFGPVSLSRADRRAVYVASVDAAGNVSDTVAVRDVVWVATLGGKVAGSTIENPHRVQVNPSVSLTTLVQDAALTTEPDAAALATADGRSLTASSEPLWIPRPVSSTGPTARSAARLAYDAIRGRTVLWGGRLETVNGGTAVIGDFASDTWEWDGVQWIETTPASGGPVGRTDFSYAWDAGRGRVVVVGGYRAFQGGGLMDDMWEYDGTTWRQVVPTGSWPKGRAYGVLVWDALRQVLLHIGGIDARGIEPDLWSWDGTTWKNLGVAPAFLSGSAAFDTTRFAVVLHCRTSSGDETWELSSAGLWARKASGASVPSSDGSQLAWDPVLQKIVLAGRAGDVWTWNGTAWTRTAPSPAPPARSGAAFAAQANGGYLLFGETPAVDAWTWTGSAWRDVTPTGLAPSPRSDHGMAYDPLAKRAVLTGGSGFAAGVEVPADTWTWDGFRWRLLAATGGPGYWDGQLLYSPLDGLVWLGGYAASRPATMVQSYLFGNQWLDLGPYMAPSLPARGYESAVVNDATGEIIVFGGYSPQVTDRTFVLDGVGWTEVTGPAGTNPVARGGALMAWDSLRQRAVLFGGVWNPSPGVQALRGDTWEFDGASWTEKTGLSTVPPARSQAAMAWDSARRRTVLVGGLTQDGALNDVWEWDGQKWTDRTPPRSVPRSFADHAMAYDGARRRMVLQGGQGTVLVPGDTYELSDDPNMRPGVLATFDWSAAGEPVSTVQTTRLTVTAGASGADLAGTAAPGVLLASWESGLAFWALRGQSTTPVATPAAMTWEVTDAAIARRSFVNGRTMHVLAVPKSGQGVGGAGKASVAVDGVELAVKYRRP